MSATPEETQTTPVEATTSTPAPTEQGKKSKAAPKPATVSTQAQARVPVPVDDIKAEFGDLPLINSSYKTDRVWTDIKDITKAKAGEKVWIRARVHTVRAKGKTCFIVLRRGLYTAQIVMFAAGENSIVKFAGKIPVETVVDVYGTVTAVEKPIESTTQKDAEIAVEKIFVISQASNLPFQLADANRHDPLDKGQNEETEDAAASTATGGNEQKEGAVIRVGQRMRLDNRYIDLRTFANHAIFRLQSKVGQYFRQFFIDRDFVEIHSPKIIPGVSEGGAAVFKLGYFGQTCCLAQSPQLYKQMGVVSDLFRVFEIGMFNTSIYNN